VFCHSRSGFSVGQSHSTRRAGRPPRQSKAPPQDDADAHLTHHAQQRDIKNIAMSTQENQNKTHTLFIRPRFKPPLAFPPPPRQHPQAPSS